MYSVITTAINCGLEAVPVRVEADISEGMPAFEMVGFLSSEVREARERVLTALRNSGYPIPAKHITVNLNPADLRKSGNGCDLPIAAALMAAFGHIDAKQIGRFILIGEVGLSGAVLPVHGVLPAAVLAWQKHYAGLIVARENCMEASILPDGKVIPISSLRELGDLCAKGFADLPGRPLHDVWRETTFDVDFSDIYGQKMAKRACEIAVSGMHNLLMIGPPGSGKTMIAQRIPTILPELDREEKLELSQIYSLCGMLGENRVVCNERPFRSPHHSVTPQALTGGGRYPRPGEISLAHHGVLFLDELPEFSHSALEALREPLEDGQIHLSRLDARFTYPADFMLVASMNPCPCGFYPDVNRCRCTPQEVRRYMDRISQALLNRIDLGVEVREINCRDMQRTGGGDSSRTIRRRVERVHAIQRERFAGKRRRFNSQMTAKETGQFCRLDAASAKLMEENYEEYGLGARTYLKVLRTARTIADMDGSQNVRQEHIAEAFLYRSPDKKYWRRY